MKTTATAKRLLSSLALVITLFAFSGAGQYSEVSAQAGGITVAPAFLTISISESSPLKEESISIRNDFEFPVELSAQLYGVDEQSPRFTPTDKIDPILSNAVHLSQTQISLQPRQSINLKVAVNANPDLTPGGHYASVVIKQINSGSRGVGFQPAISVPIYIIKEDGAVRKLSLEPFSLPRVSFSLPKTLTYTFRNEGNVRLVPRATTSVMSGIVTYGSSVPNNGSLPILPGQSLRLESALQKQKNSLLPRKYHVNTLFRYEGQDSQHGMSQSLWIIPRSFVILSSSICLILLLSSKRISRKVRNRSRNKKV